MKRSNGPNLGPLPDQAHVIIIGGGPGGVACALALQRLAARLGRSLQITILEGKDFHRERHYNQCAGVLSPPLPRLLEEELDVPFPYHLSRGAIEGYVLHSRRQQLDLPETGEPSIALRRVQFDDYMLEQARQRGIAIWPARAVDLELHADGVVVYSENAPLEGDVVVGAFGLDEGTGAIFTRAAGYRPPNYLSSVVTKYHPGPEAMAQFGCMIHTFLPTVRHVEFGAVTPKGNHLTINIAGEAVDAPTMQLFLALPEVQALLPNLHDNDRHESNDMRIFKGRFPRSLAHRFYGDRYIMIGDAAGLLRAFKGKGVTSAVQTGIRAAQTLLLAGISQQAFDSHYRQANRDIIDDMPYGYAMRRLTMVLSHTGQLDAVLDAARQQPALRTALFDAISAHAPYRQVVAHSMRPSIVAAVVRAGAGNLLQRG